MTFKKSKEQPSKELIKEETKKEDNEISVGDVLIDHEDRLRNIEASIYRLKNL